MRYGSKVVIRIRQGLPYRIKILLNSLILVRRESAWWQILRYPVSTTTLTMTGGDVLYVCRQPIEPSTRSVKKKHLKRGTSGVSLTNQLLT